MTSPLYSLYIPKTQNEKPTFLIIKVIKDYLDTLSKNNSKIGILSSPGFLSRTDYGIKHFVDEFCKIVPSNIAVGYFNGMNGNHHINNNPKEIILEKHYDLFNLKKIGTINLISKSLTDHRKMIFFFSSNSYDFQRNNLSLTNYEMFLKKIKLHAILIGSSNQSYSTYFSNAKYGEADLLMFIDDDFFDRMAAMLEDEPRDDTFAGCVLFKSVAGIHSDAEQYLKDILRQFLQNNLMP